MGIPNSTRPLFLAAAGQAAGGAGYEIERSVRFNSSDSAYLSRAVTAGKTTFTFSVWVKRTNLNSYHAIFGSGTSSTSSTSFFFDSASGKFYAYGDGGVNHYSTEVYRDFSAWYHIVVSVNNKNGTAYVNGQEVTFTPSLTFKALYSNIVIGVSGTDALYAFDGYMADFHFIDGQALTAADFGELDENGVWQPKAYAGTYGTDGAHLPFSDNSTAAALGTDTSGNGNDWTVNNIAVGGGAQPALYSSPNLYTDAADVIANGTPLSSGGTFSNVYVYIVTNGGGDVGSKVFTADGSGDIGTTWTWLHRIGSSWEVSGSYNNTEWDLFTWGSQTVGTSYIMNNSAPLHMLVSSTGSPQQVSGTIATFNSTPNSGAGNDSLVDSPTNYGEDTGVGGEVRGNYATLNPLVKNTYGATLTNGNLQISVPTTGHSRSTVGIISGKWYAEYTHGTGLGMCGVADGNTDTDLYLGQTTGGNGFGYYSAGTTYTDGAGGVAYGASYTTGDVVGIAFDADNGTLVFYKNGSSQGTAFTGLTSGPYFFAAGVDTMANSHMNFGQRPFAPTAPSGFKALCTTNLAEPTIADGSTAMDVALYTGNGSTQTISGLNFSPDFVWMKTRSVAEQHELYDSNRGATKVLFSDFTDAEYTVANGVTSFNSDGWTMGNRPATNQSGRTYVAWTWDAGSSTVTNTQGSISSQVRANASAGFSVVTYTGTGANATLGHGLGVAPRMIIAKQRDTTRAWAVYHRSVGGIEEGFNWRLELQSNAAAVVDYLVWNGTAPTSTVFSVSTSANTNANGGTYVAYCFAPVAGYSSFGSYTGNGSTDGPFVYTGFRPRWILIKRSDATNDWLLTDSSRLGYNIRNELIWVNLSAAEYQIEHLDILSNGFKIRTTNSGWNGSGGTYIYAAFAENPFQYARAR